MKLGFIRLDSLGICVLTLLYMLSPLETAAAPVQVDSKRDLTSLPEVQLINSPNKTCQLPSKMYHDKSAATIQWTGSCTDGLISGKGTITQKAKDGKLLYQFTGTIDKTTKYWIGEFTKLGWDNDNKYYWEVKCASDIHGELDGKCTTISDVSGKQHIEHSEYSDGVYTLPQLRINRTGLTFNEGTMAISEPLKRIYATSPSDKRIKIYEYNDWFKQPVDNTNIFTRFVQSYQRRTRYVGELPFQIGGGYDGTINALAVSPGGLFLAAGGNTNCSFSSACQVYVFDLKTETIVTFIDIGRQPINRIEWSVDGRHLLVQSVDRRWSIFEMIDGGMTGKIEIDRDINDAQSIVTLAGSKIVVGIKDSIRIYKIQDHRLELESQRNLDNSGQIDNISFNPISGIIGVIESSGQQERRRYQVYLGRQMNLASLEPVVTEDESAHIFDNSSTRIQWLGSGKVLVLGGRPSDTASGCVNFLAIKEQKGSWVHSQSWNASTRCPTTTLLDANVDRAFIGLQGGRPVILSFEPTQNDAVGIWNQASYESFEFIWAQAGIDYKSAPTALNVINNKGRRAFKVSDDGSYVEIYSDSSSKYLYGFDAENHKILIPRMKESSAPVLPDGHDFAVDYSGIYLDQHLISSLSPIPVNNGYQVSYGVATNVDHSIVAVGQKGALIILDKDGHTLNRFDLDPNTGPIYINIPSKGPYIVAQLSDDTIAWFNRETGTQTQRLLVTELGQWILWTPDGYFDCSPGACKYLEWHVNSGRNRGARIVNGEQLYDVLYNPDIIRSRYLGDVTALQSSAIDSLKSPPPRPAITKLSVVAPNRISVCYSVKNLGGGIGEARIYSNDKLALTVKSASGGAQNEQGCREIKVASGAVKVGLVATERTNQIISKQVEQSVSVADGGRERKIYIASFVVGEYPRLPVLNFRDGEIDTIQRDIDNLARYLRGLYGSDNVILVSLSGNAANSQNVLLALDNLAKRIEPEDILITYLETHGGKIPSASGVDSVEFLMSDAQVAGDRFIGVIPFSEFFDKLSHVSAYRQLVLIDTCFSGAAISDISANTASTRLAQRMGLHVVTSSSKDAPSWGTEFIDAMGGALKRVVDLNGTRQTVSISKFASLIEESAALIYNDKFHPRAAVEEYKKAGQESSSPPQASNFGADFDLFDANLFNKSAVQAH